MVQGSNFVFKYLKGFITELHNSAGVFFLFLSDCYHENGRNYRGMVRKTRKGITCQRWNVNTPHRTRYTNQFNGV